MVTKDTTRSRSNFRLTRTLKDAFEAISRTITIDTKNGASSVPSATADDCSRTMDESVSKYRVIGGEINTYDI